MVVRKRRKKNKLRGNRFQGKGNTKNRRGGGRRGGKGRAGSHKHKFASYWMTFGIKKRLKPRAKKGLTMNIIQAEQLIPTWLNEKKAVMEGKSVVLDGKILGVRKLLSNGELKSHWIVKNMELSAAAKEKITAAGGTIEELKSK